MTGKKEKAKFVSMQELAETIGKAYGTVVRAVKAGKIKSVRFGGSIRIPKSEEERIMREGY